MTSMVKVGLLALSLALVATIIATAQWAPMRPLSILTVEFVGSNGEVVGILEFFNSASWGHVVVNLVNNTLNYYIIAVNMSSLGELVGYTEVNGSLLKSIAAGGPSYVYSWVLANVAMKPINKYPLANIKVYVKSPSGEEVTGGILCVVPAMFMAPGPWGPRILFFNWGFKAECVKNVSGPVTFTGLPSIPYFIMYYNVIRLSGTPRIEAVEERTINIYGYSINVTTYVGVINITNPQAVLVNGLNVAVPSNSAVYLTIRIRPLAAPPWYAFIAASSARQVNENTSINESDPLSVLSLLSGASTILAPSNASIATAAYITERSASIRLNAAAYLPVILAITIAILAGIASALAIQHIMYRR